MSQNKSQKRTKGELTISKNETQQKYKDSQLTMSKNELKF